MRRRGDLKAKFGSKKEEKRMKYKRIKGWKEKEKRGLGRERNEKEREGMKEK